MTGSPIAPSASANHDDPPVPPVEDNSTKFHTAAAAVDIAAVDIAAGSAAATAVGLPPLPPTPLGNFTNSHTTAAVDIAAVDIAAGSAAATAVAAVHQVMLPPLPPTPLDNSTSFHTATAVDSADTANDIVNPDNAAADHMEVKNPVDDEYSGMILPNFNQPAETFDAEVGVLSTSGALAESAGFNSQYVTIHPSTKVNNGFTMINYIFHFNSEDGTKTIFSDWIGGNKCLSDALEFAFLNKFAVKGELNLGVLVSPGAINLANAMSYPTDECAVIIKNNKKAASMEKVHTRILHLKKGVFATSHAKFCDMSGISLDTIMSHDIVDSKINAGLLGLPFQGSDACTAKFGDDRFWVYHSDGSLIGPPRDAYYAFRIVLVDELRLATKAMMEVRGIVSVAALRRSFPDELSSIWLKRATSNFLNHGSDLPYTWFHGFNDCIPTFGPYKYSALVKFLYSKLTLDDYDANPDVAGLMLCLTQRVQLGDYLSIDSDCRLRQAAIGVIEVEGGGEENGLVYHPQRTDAEYEVDGHGYSAVQIDTILLAKVNSLHGSDGNIDVCVGQSDDLIVARYGGIQEHEDGSDSIVLSVFYSMNYVSGKLVRGEETVYLSASETVVAENLYVVEFPGSLPTFYEESDQLDDLIELRVQMEGGASEIGNDSDAESFNVMEVEQVDQHVMEV